MFCLYYSGACTACGLVCDGVFVRRCWLAKAHPSIRGWHGSADEAGKPNFPAACFPHGQKNTAVLMRKRSSLETYADTTHCETMHHKDEASFSFHVYISPNWLAFNTVKFSKNMANMVTWTPKSPCVCLTALTFKCSLWWCLARTWSYGNQQTIVSMRLLSATHLCLCVLHGED